MQNKIKIKLRYIIIMVLIGAVSSLHGQPPLRQVSSSVNISKIFAVPTTTNIQEDLTSYDFSRMIWEERAETTHKVIDQDYKLSITGHYHNQPGFDRDFEFMVGSSISNEYGTMLFGHDGALLDSIEYQTPLDIYTIHQDSVGFFGLNNLFEMELDSLAYFYEQYDFTVAISDSAQTLSAINDTMEIYYNMEKLTYETRFFEEEILVFSDWLMFRLHEGYIVPMLSVFTTYEELVNGIKMQVSEVKRYTMYCIVENGDDTLVSFHTETLPPQRQGNIEFGRYNETPKQQHELKVYPNPATGLINIEIPLFVSEVIHCEIINTQGVVLYRNAEVPSGTTISVDVSSFKPGVYILRCGKGSKWMTTRFVKQ